MKIEGFLVENSIELTRYGMCGICGEVGKAFGYEVARGRIKKMNDALAHRGPDDEGYHVHEMIGLGQRRLSIIDLARGHQPIARQ